MISQHQIVRLLETKEFRQLIERILANGRCRSVLARRVLARPEAAEVAALGLAIQRLCEITYRPAPQTAALVSRLLQHQRPDGTFATAPTGDENAILASTSVAIRALIAHRSQAAAFGTPAAAPVDHAIARGVNMLATAAMQRLDHEHIDSPAAWAIILWQLGDVDQFRNRVSTESLLELLDQAGAEIIEDELTRYAHAMAA